MIFALGDLVRIRDKSKYGGKMYGKIGTVTSCYQGTVTVRVDGETNRASSSGVFYFGAARLKKVKQEEVTMLNGYQVAMIKFLNGDKRYPYALYDKDIRPGDLVVVATGHHGLALAKVDDIQEDAPAELVEYDRQIVAKVDLLAWQARKEKAKELAGLKKEMDDRVQAFQETQLYRLVAQTDATMADLLERFNSLSQE